MQARALVISAVSGISVLAWLGGCSDDAPTKRDAAADVKVDAPADASQCGSDLFYAGELVDWDSTGVGSAFCGIFGATVAAHGVATPTDMTPPNGRIQLCVAPAATTPIDITPPTDPSPCESMVAAPGTYTLPGISVANEAVIATGKTFSFRMFTSERAATFFGGIGEAMEPGTAQLLVNEIGTPAVASITAIVNAPTQAFDGTTWGTGSSGTEVFFPNIVVPTGGTDTLTIAGGATGAGTIPLVADTITMIAVVTP